MCPQKYQEFTTLLAASNVPVQLRHSLVKAHYLSVPRLVLHIMKKHKVSYTFVQSKKCPNHYIINGETILKDIAIDEITMQAWNIIMSFYDELMAEDEFDLLMESLSPYTQYRINQFIEDYKEFQKTGEHFTWIELREQTATILDDAARLIKLSMKTSKSK